MFRFIFFLDDTILSVPNSNITTNLNRYPKNIPYNFSYFNFLFMAKYEDESDRKTNGISKLFKTNGISDLNTWKYNKFDDSL